MIDIHQAKRHPSTVFASPQQVLDEPSLSKEDKIIILRNWANDEQEKLVADEENMGNGDSSYILDAIHNALLIILESE